MEWPAGVQKTGSFSSSYYKRGNTKYFPKGFNKQPVQSVFPQLAPHPHATRHTSFNCPLRLRSIACWHVNGVWVSPWQLDLNSSVLMQIASGFLWFRSSVGLMRFLLCEEKLSFKHGWCLPALNLDWGSLCLYTDALLICMTGILISLTLPFKTQTWNVGFRTARPARVNFKCLFKYFIKM